MAALSTGKIAEVMFEKALETYEHQMQMLPLVDHWSPSSADLQNAGNFVWRPVQQHAPVIDGFDLTGQETGIIEETYPAILGTPKNDLFEQRVDDLRDMTFWERRGEQSGKKQATTLNKGIADVIADTGSLYIRSNATSGYSAIAEAQALLNERQAVKDDMRYFLLNDRDNLKYGSDLAARQTLQGRPEQTWKTGQIGQNVAEFDVYTGSFLKTITGGAATTTTSAAVSDKPEGGSVAANTGVVTNVDYRISSDIPLVAANFDVGDVVEFGVNAVGLADKTDTGQLMTFRVVEVSGLNIKVFPKPIALDDASLTDLEKAYANIATQIGSGATVNRVNTDASAKSNVFWCKNSIEVLGGDAPVDLLNQFGGMRVMSETMSNGQKMYMAYDGNIKTMQFTCRLFTWYGITNTNPSANGVLVTF